MKNDKTKIVFLLEWYFPIGGIESSVWEWATELSKSKCVYLLVSFKGKAIDLKQPSNIHIIDISQKNIWEIIKIISQIKPDIIHTNHVSTIGVAGLLSSKKLKIPLITTNHQIPEYNGSKLSNLFLWQYYKFFDNQSDFIIVPSKLVKEKLIKNKIRSSIKKISNGIDTEFYVPPKNKVINKETNFLFVGRLSKEKGLKNLVYATKKALMTNQDIKVNIVGFPSANKRNDFSLQFERLIKKENLENTINIIGYLSPKSGELLNQYQKNDVFLIPSYFETQSLVTLEAMSCGLPVISSDGGALPEIVLHNQNGLIFDRKNPEQLATNMIKLCDPKIRDLMGKKSSQLAKKHDLSNSINQYKRLLKDIFILNSTQK